VDGPQFISRESFLLSLTRVKLLHKMGIPSISIVKNPSGSPIMRACGITDTTDTAFFEYLEAGERSPMFLRLSEGTKKIPSQEFLRVFWYYKTERGFISRCEVPFWSYQEKRFQFPEIVAADSAMDGGKMSFLIGKADSIARIKQSMRATIRSLQKNGFTAHDVPYCAPYNQDRWGDF